jgi:hypothetical protein
MNIFILDDDLERCVQYYVDKHIVKMPTESTQILSSVVRKSGIDAGYKITHKNHPCVIWAETSLSNWLWLKSLVKLMNNEWKFRYKHIHDHKAYEMSLMLPKPKIDDIGLTQFAICVDSESKCDDPIKSYRHYYQTQKQHLFSWKNRSTPEWLNI